MNLRILADENFEKAVKSQTKDVDDLKINLNRTDLASHIGLEAVLELEKIFEDKYDEIIIRRCQAHGKFINFHTDVSLKTMQVALNGDDEYNGGKLLYAT